MGNKDAYYFSHDANALSDPKILAMRCDYGFESYGLYFAIIEMLRNEAEYKLPLNKTTFRAIKMQTGTTIEDIEKYIQDCISEYIDNETGNGLFVTDGKYFWSASLLRRMNKYEQIKQKRVEAANSRWGNNQNRKSGKNTKKMQNKCKSIRKIYKCNASAYKKIYKCNANLKKVYAKLCKSNQIKSNQMKLNKIKLKEIKSIYPSSHKPQNQKIDMDETDKIDFEAMISNCEMHILSPELAIEITEILKEMYMQKDTRKKVKEMNSKRLLYALKKFTIANTKSQIQIPKSYFKKCILTALEQTELSSQYDADTIMLED